MIAPQTSVPPGKYFSSSKRKRKYHSGRAAENCSDGIRRRAEFRAVITEDQKEHDEQHGQAGDGVPEHLIGPEGGVGPAARFLRRDAVFAKEVDVREDEAR